MSWTSPITFTDGAVLTAAQLNANLRDNINETAAAKASTAGGYFVATGTNTIVERIGGADQNLTSGTTSSTSYTDLTGTAAGPSVTVTSGTTAMVAMTVEGSNSSANAAVNCAYAVSDATTLSASDDRMIQIDGLPADQRIRCSLVVMQTGLTAGSNTFTMKYKVLATPTATFRRRDLLVMPF